MPLSDPPLRLVGEIFDLYSRLGERRYGEDVSQLDHALQSAHHAMADKAPQSLVAAALLHDIGHLLDKRGEDAAEQGLDTRHEHIGSGYLVRAFGPEVTEPIRLHVEAKRYLAACEPGYLDRLSRASTLSLALQGGPMTEAEAMAFLTERYCGEAIRLRRYDELGKVHGAEPAGLATYRDLLNRMAHGRSSSQSAHDNNAK